MLKVVISWTLINMNSYQLYKHIYIFVRCRYTAFIIDPEFRCTKSDQGGAVWTVCRGRPRTSHRVPDQKGGQTGKLINTQVNVL